MQFIDLLQTFARRITRPFPWSQPSMPSLATAAVVAPPLEPGQVLAQRTKLTRTAAKSVLHAALRQALSREPSLPELKMLLAQSDLETRGWQAMWNWNFGNSTVGNQQVAWFTLKDESAPHKYRSFSSAAEGAQYYATFLKRRYPDAWMLLGSEDTLAFAQALKDQGYYEAPVETYAQGLTERYARA